MTNRRMKAHQKYRSPTYKSLYLLETPTSIWNKGWGNEQYILQDWFHTFIISSTLRTFASGVDSPCVELRFPIAPNLHQLICGL